MGREAVTLQSEGGGLAELNLSVIPFKASGMGVKSS